MHDFPAEFVEVMGATGQDPRKMSYRRFLALLQAVRRGASRQASAMAQALAQAQPKQQVPFGR